MARRFAALLVSGSATLVIAAGAGIAAETSSAVPAVDPYAPGLGDFMTAYVQPHHIKLWLAGSAGNWKLAAYEADELGETFEDVTTYQATWKNVPVAQLVKEIIQPALNKVDAAIAGENVAAFKTAYGVLTAACNSCHTMAQREFLEIKVPRADPFSDQNFNGH